MLRNCNSFYTIYEIPSGVYEVSDYKNTFGSLTKANVSIDIITKTNCD